MGLCKKWNEGKAKASTGLSSSFIAEGKILWKQWIASHNLSFEIKVFFNIALILVENNLALI